MVKVIPSNLKDYSKVRNVKNGNSNVILRGGRCSSSAILRGDRCSSSALLRGDRCTSSAILRSG